MMSLPVRTDSTEQSWPRVQIGDCCDPRIETVVPEAAPDDEFTYVDISAVDASTKQITAPKKLEGRQASSRARQLLRTGDVLVSTVRPNLNAVAMVGPELDGAVGSTGFCVLRAKSELEPEFLFGWVRSTEFVEKLSALVAGAMYPAVSDKQVRALDIPHPPPDEQRRIAIRLRDKLADVDCARTAVLAQLDAAQKLPFALIHESLNGERTEVRLGEVLEEITQGVGDDWKAVPLWGATRAGLALAREPIGKSPERYKPVKTGSIFYNPMRVLIGSIAFVEEGAGIVSPDYVAFTTKEGRLHSRWFYHWLRSHAGEHFIRGLARGAVRERILFNRLAEGVVAIPSWSRQLDAVKQMQGIPALIELLQAQLTGLDHYPAALLRDAFAGRL
jgi:type I restriction enzyme S subunit